MGRFWTKTRSYIPIVSGAPSWPKSPFHNHGGIALGRTDASPCS